MTTKPQPEPCKHCHERIARVTCVAPHSDPYWYHLSTGKHRCDVEPYGYHAEPVGTACTAGGPNPCAGAKRPHTLGAAIRQAQR